MKMIELNKSIQSSRFGEWLSRMVLKVIGWKATGIVPSVPKYVMVGYPHTSNWDTLLGVLVFKSLGVKVHWVGKHTLFKKPLGWFVKKIGGVPVIRHDPRDFVQQMVDIFNRSKELVLTLSPEGTRTKTDYWKTGFYRIAFGANVPISMGFLDYSRKTGGFGPLIYPSGDMQTDLEPMKIFFASIRGRFPEKQAPIRFNPEKKSSK